MEFPLKNSTDELHRFFYTHPMKFSQKYVIIQLLLNQNTKNR